MLPILVALLVTAGGPQTQRLSSGIPLTHSATIRAGVYRLASTDSVDPTAAALKINGSGIVIDFHGATLRGTSESVAPDARQGIGIYVTGSRITIKNLKVRGYKIGLFGEGVKGLKLLNCDFSYNWKQHLRSTPEQEDEADWQSYHQNEQREWFRYGAGAYLEKCSNFEVKNCRATGGQCGLMLSQSTNGLVWNSNFSYLSGIGVGLYRSSRNRIMHNRIDYCVRGYSYGIYNRGQDSSGILVYESSNKNTFAFNSATHGGDGFFLWAGQTTMDSGTGGCNGNLVYGNDFSHAIANGIEATFSQNQFDNNLLAECDHGFWGGYSYSSLFENNIVLACHNGVSIEHGQDNVIKNNRILVVNRGVHLWADPIQDPAWGYPKHHQTDSSGNLISGNTIASATGPDVEISRTHDSEIVKNRLYGPAAIDADKYSSRNRVEQPILARSKALEGVAWAGKMEFPGNISKLIAKANWSPYHKASEKVLPLPGGMNPMIPRGVPRGRSTILVDDWGPYTGKFPKVWCPTGVPDANNDWHLHLMGPKGKASLKALGGGKASQTTNIPVPGWLTVHSNKTGVLRISLAYRGGATTDELGRFTPAGKPVLFGYGASYLPINWTAKFFAWDAKTDPRTMQDAFDALLTTPPINTVRLNKMAFSKGGGWAQRVPADYFAIDALGDMTLPAGDYELELVTDDGARIFLDGRLLELATDSGEVTSAWKYQGGTRYHTTIKLDGQAHELHLQYFQIDGGKVLTCRLQPVRPAK